MRRPLHLALVGGAGLAVGAGLYPLSWLLSQVLASSCRDDGLDTIGTCLLGGLASLVTAGFVLSVVAAVVLWRLEVPFGPLVPAVGYFAGAALAWRLFWLFNDLQELLGRSVVWLGVAAVPLLYVGLLLLVTRTGGRLVGVGEGAGVALLLVAFVAPGAVEGTERRRYLASQREWLRSLPFTIYEPLEVPPGYALTSAEGRYNAIPQLKLNLRGPERSMTITESVPYPAFAPPGTCGTGYPSDRPVPNTGCERVAAMPSGEPIWFQFSRSSRQPMYAVQLGTTVVTVTPPSGSGLGERPEGEFLRMVQSLRPIPAGELGARVFDD